MIVSCIEGRIRLRIPELKKSAVADSLVSNIKNIEGVDTVDVNHIVGSILVLYNPGVISTKNLLDELSVQLSNHSLNLKIPKQSSFKVNTESNKNTRKKKRNKKNKSFYRMFAAVGMLTVISPLLGLRWLHATSGAIFAGMSVAHAMDFKGKIT